MGFVVDGAELVGVGVVVFFMAVLGGAGGGEGGWGGEGSCYRLVSFSDVDEKTLLFVVVLGGLSVVGGDAAMLGCDVGVVGCVLDVEGGVGVFFLGVFAFDGSEDSFFVVVFEVFSVGELFFA